LWPLYIWVFNFLNKFYQKSLEVACVIIKTSHDIESSILIKIKVYVKRIVEFLEDQPGNYNHNSMFEVRRIESGELGEQNTDEYKNII